MEYARRYRRYIVLTVIAILAVYALIWLSQQSRIELTQTGNGQYAYQLYKQGDKKTLTFNSSDKTVRKKLPKGSYEVLAQNGTDSFMEVTSLHGFLRKTTVTIKPLPEHERVFVGKSPEQCMDSINGSSFSYSCPGGMYKDVKYHVPPTKDFPTYVTNPTIPGQLGQVEGTFTTPSGNYILIKTAADNPQHKVYKLGNASDVLNLVDAKGIALNGADANSTYNVRAFDKGFLVYSPDFSNMLYYSDINGSPTTMSLGKPKTKGLSANQDIIDASNGTLLTAYYQGNPGGNPGAAPVTGQTEVDYGKPGAVKHFVIPGDLSGAQFCGTNKFCLLNSSNIMTVYDIAGKKPRELYKVYDINSILSTPTGLLAASKSQKAIFKFDVDQRTAYIDYSLGDFNFSRMQPLMNGYIVSVTDNKKQEFALSIDSAKQDTDSIDKKVLAIESNPILTVTPYGNVIYITPYIGSLAYNPATGQFDYDPLTKSIAINQMNSAIDNAGVNRNKYTIISTVQ